MFIDSAKIFVRAGKGGDGAVSFLREKYKPMGGPNGGDGGDGGDIIIETDASTHGLAQFNTQKTHLAENGQNGMGDNKHGKNGKDLVLRMPPGTQIFDGDTLLADLLEPGARIVIAKGGNGGWGNQHFASSVKQAPKWSKQGMLGDSYKLRLELKTIADIGLVGLPNAGKSTLLSVLSNARPRIADYPFTTLEPNLGVLKDSDVNVVIADIPGLIEGASVGKGLGDKFLKHIERTKMILHLLPADSADIIYDYKAIRKELSDFSPLLATKPEIVVVNKIDVVAPEVEKEILSKFKKLKIEPILISGATHANIDKLRNIIKLRLQKLVC